MAARYLRETYRILEALDRDEYAALNANDKKHLWYILSLGVVDFSEDSMAKALLRDLFGEGTATRANLENLEKPIPEEEPE